MYDAVILQILTDALKAAVAASDLPDIPISFVSVGFEVPDDQKYIEMVFIPNNPDGDFVGSGRNYMGMMRIILHWPNHGGGPGEPLAGLGSIVAYFSKGRMLADVQISVDPKFMGVLEQGKEIMYPVSVRYQCFRPS